MLKVFYSGSDLAHVNETILIFAWLNKPTNRSGFGADKKCASQKRITFIAINLLRLFELFFLEINRRNQSDLTYEVFVLKYILTVC